MKKNVLCMFNHCIHQRQATGFFLYLRSGRVETEMLCRGLVCLSFSLKRIFEVNTRSKIDSSSIISRQLPRQTGNRFSAMLHLHGEMTVTDGVEILN